MDDFETDDEGTIPAPPRGSSSFWYENPVYLALMIVAGVALALWLFCRWKRKYHGRHTVHSKDCHHDDHDAEHGHDDHHDTTGVELPEAHSEHGPSAPVTLPTIA